MSKLLVCTLLLTAMCQIACNSTPNDDETKTHPSNEILPLGGVIRGYGDVSLSGAHLAWINVGEGKLMRTEDGGINWETISIKAVDGITTFGFLDAQNGWAVSTQGEVLRTSDSGRSWILISKLEGYMQKQQIGFVDELHGWILEPYSIWRTTDGGVNWQYQDLQGYRNGIAQAFQFHFINSEIGWLNGPEGLILHTTDGGKTWLNEGIKSDGDIVDLVFIDELTGWASSTGGDDEPGKIYRSDDGGKSWQLQLGAQYIEETDQVEMIRSIQFINRNKGWAVGYQDRNEQANGYEIWGVVLHTIDGGKNWHRIYTGEKGTNYQKVHFADEQHGWLFSLDTVYRTNDGGKTWSAVLNLPSKTISEDEVLSLPESSAITR